MVIPYNIWPLLEVILIVFWQLSFIVLFPNLGPKWITPPSKHLLHVNYHFLKDLWVPLCFAFSPHQRRYEKELGLFVITILLISSTLYWQLFLRWHSGKEFTCQCRRRKRHGFNPCVRKIPWRKKWQPAPVFLPGKSHGQRNLVGYCPWGRKK